MEETVSLRTNTGDRLVAVEFTVETDEMPFIGVDIRDDETGETRLDLVIEDADDADKLLTAVTNTVAEFKRRLAAG